MTRVRKVARRAVGRFRFWPASWKVAPDDDRCASRDLRSRSSRTLVAVINELSRRDTLGLAAAVPCTGVAGASCSSAQNVKPETPRVSVTAFGAKGDGLSDDAPAFQAALDTGADVFVPAATRHYRLTRTLATARAGQRLCGEGARSHLVQTGSGENATVLALAHDHASVVDMRITPGTATQVLNEGWGVTIAGVRHCMVARCRFDGMRRGGVLLLDGAACLVHDNSFTDSVVPADGNTLQQNMGYDILIAGSSSHNVVRDNLCVSGCGTGIGCQTVADGKTQTGNVIRSNVIRDHPCYGIMVYLSGSKGGIRGIVVAGNTIDRISGSVRTPERTIFYGAGIYIQTANDFLIEGNRLSATNTDRRLPMSGSAVPAAIAVSGYGNGIVANNMIRDCWDGVASIQTTVRVPDGEGTLITGNVISDCDRTGINLSDCAAASVCSNRLTARGDAAMHGIFVRRTSAAARMGEFIISDNVVRDFHAGIEVEGAAIEQTSITGNTVMNNRGYGIATAATTSIVATNIVRGRYGVAISANARRGWCRDNVLEVTDVAVIDDSGSGVTTFDNLIPSRTGSVSTGLALRESADQSAAKRWTFWPANTPIRDLGIGYEGQERTILVQGAVQLVDGQIVSRGRIPRTLVDGEVVSFVYLAGRWRETS
nr:right-handed parallel beta-helix repeat-containing protein [Sphingomonas jejuensis]